MEQLSDFENIQKVLKPQDSFLVELKDNVYGVRFIGFKLRDYDTGEVYHEYKANNIYELDYFADHMLEYEFPNKLLRSKTIGSDLTFVVGDNPVKNLDFVEKHFIDDELVKSYEFKFPFFMPNSQNNIEFIYSVPELKSSVAERLNSNEDINAKSDTYVFVEGKLIIHRRAEYRYTKK